MSVCNGSLASIAASLPTLDKCRTLINQYGRRKELVVQRWLHTGEIMPYLNLSQEELFRQVASGKLKPKVQERWQTLKFCVSGAFEFDDCFLAKSGGQCSISSHAAEQRLAGWLNVKALMPLNVKALMPNTQTQKTYRPKQR